MMASETVEIPGEVDTVNSTTDAYLFTDGNSTVWLPRSQCEWDPDAREMTMPEWLAIDRGLM